MISLDKEYRTRDGRKVRLLCVDGPDEGFPVVGFIEGQSGVFFWGSTGAGSKITQTASDLIESKPRVKKTVWMHHYKNGSYNMFSKNVPAHKNAIARTKHEIDVEHGHGLGDANE